MIQRGLGHKKHQEAQKQDRRSIRAFRVSSCFLWLLPEVCDGRTPGGRIVPTQPAKNCDELSFARVKTNPAKAQPDVLGC